MMFWMREVRTHAEPKSVSVSNLCQKHGKGLDANMDKQLKKKGFRKMDMD